MTADQTPAPTAMLRQIWKLKSRSLVIDSVPLVMGIVNATPDSFSDGGKFVDPQLAVEHALQLAAAGAAIVDVGGESTRPYSEPVDADEEIRRVIPVIEGVRKSSDVVISIDTSKADVAAAAIKAGADIINDVTGLEGDPEMIQVALDSKAGICAMHMQGSPQTMQDDPTYDYVVLDIFEYLKQRKTHLLSAGIEPERICLDPGVGFGKTHQDNIDLLAGCEKFLELECPILIGHSRKGFIGKLIGDKEAERDSGTLAISLLMAQKGMHLLRVHEVERTVRALKVLAGVGGL
jgi:dihydropteroate synthase